VTFTNYGANGQTLASFVDGTTEPPNFRMDALIASAPDLIIFSYGINDVRTGSVTKDELVALIKTAINTIRAALPSTDIILRMPNSFLTIDTGPHNYITTTSGIYADAGMTLTEASQAASTILKDAYREVDGLWDNVVLFDTQKNIFPEVCPTAITLMMNDQIHPTITAYRILIDQLVQDYFGETARMMANNGGYNIGKFNVMRDAFAKTFNVGVALGAVNTVGYRLAPTVYPQIVLNGDYELVLAGYANSAISANATNITIVQFVNGGLYTEPSTKGGAIKGDDIVIQLTDTGAFAALFLTTGTNAKNTTAVNITNGFNSTSPNALVAQRAGQPILVYRNKYANSANAKAIALQAVYTARQVYRVSASANGSISFSSYASNNGIAPVDVQWTPRAGDVLSFQDIADITLTSAMTMTMNAYGSVITINQSGTNFTTTSKLVQIAGVGAQRKEVNLAQPLTLDIDGAVTSTTINRYVTRNARYTKFTGYLDTPDATTATTVTVRTILNGILSDIAVVTFAANSNTPEITYTHNYNLPIVAGVKIAFVVVSGGAGVEGLHLTFEQ